MKNLLKTILGTNEPNPDPIRHKDIIVKELKKLIKKGPSMNSSKAELKLAELYKNSSPEEIKRLDERAKIIIEEELALAEKEKNRQ